ncbi:hypothetical protein ACOZ38_21065 [Sphaerisporangium viridialbum]|uniref:hypothetical protein n=1 Tax=Sphaerisporangium viridialbum TaxID=46189 RepID=UPI003C72AABD
MRVGRWATGGTFIVLVAAGCAVPSLDRSGEARDAAIQAAEREGADIELRISRELQFREGGS